MYLGKICVLTCYVLTAQTLLNTFDISVIYEFHTVYLIDLMWFKPYVCLDCEYNRREVWIYQIVDSIVNNPVDNPFSTLPETVVMRWTPIIEDMKWIKSWVSFKQDATWDYILQFGGLALYIIIDLIFF